MPYTCVPSQDLYYWRKRLPRPWEQWKPGASAYEVARAWIGTGQGLPPTFEPLREFGEPFATMKPLITIPAFSHTTYSNLEALASHEAGLASVVVEAKCEEGFGRTVSEWLIDASPDKRHRTDIMLELLGLTAAQAAPVSYSLLRRASEAVREAERFRANVAVIAVQSFSADATGFDDFDQFIRLFQPDTPAAVNAPLLLGSRNGIALYAAWVRDEIKPYELYDPERGGLVPVEDLMTHFEVDDYQKVQSDLHADLEVAQELCDNWTVLRGVVRNAGFKPELVSITRPGECQPASLLVRIPCLPEDADAAAKRLEDFFCDTGQGGWGYSSLRGRLDFALDVRSATPL